MKEKKIAELEAKLKASAPPPPPKKKRWWHFFAKLKNLKFKGRLTRKLNIKLDNSRLGWFLKIVIIIIFLILVVLVIAFVGDLILSSGTPPAPPAPPQITV